MFRYYRDAEKCYVYLSDVSTGSGQNSRGPLKGGQWRREFEKSRWFTRGWTLQELLAPSSVEFFSQEGMLLGAKKDLGAWLSEITAIPTEAFQGGPLSHFSAEERFSWAAKRTTKHKEDKAYSLFGIFGVFLPIIYGEGEENAMRRLHESVSSAEDKIRGQQQKLLRSLQFDQMNFRQTDIRGAHHDTCHWLLRNPAYLDWLNTTKMHQHHGFLWIKGKAGSGKSTIMKFVHGNFSKAVEHCPSSSVVGNEITTSPAVLAFFFTARGVLIERSTIGMYRSLLAQLLERPLYLLHVLSVLPFPVSQLSDNYQWTAGSLQELLKELILSVEAPVTCFVDALDECEEEEIRRMVYYLEQVGSLAMSKNIQFRVCFASRPYPHISLKRGLELILHEQGGHKQDIASYVRAELRIKQNESADQVRRDLKRRSSGIFMWVVLVVDILNRLYDGGQSRQTVQRRLQDIPDDLHQLLRDILTRDTKNRDQLASCIEWVLFATHPLSPEQLYFAINIGTQSTESPEWDQDDITYEDMRRFILDSSKGLVEITLTDEPKTQFIHESVRDLFLKGSGRDLVWPDIETNFQPQIHKRLYRRCLHYTGVSILLQPETFEQSHTTLTYEKPRFKVGSLSLFPFLNYALHNLFVHAAMAGQFSTAGELVVTKSFSCIKRFERFIVPASVFLSEQVRGQSRDLSMIYSVAQFTGSSVLFFAHITDGGNRFLRVFVGDSEVKQLDRVSSLEDSAFGPDLEFRKSGRHVLSYLTEVGDKELLMAMLDTGLFDVNSKDQDGNTPLFWAAKREDEDIVKLLLDAGADANAPCANFGNVLQFTAAAGLERIMSLLLSRGADAHARGGYYGNTLQAAIVTGSEPMARLLLENGADVNARGGTYANALYAASTGGQKHLIELLLDHGAKINARGGYHGSALQAAIKNDHVDIVKLLKARGAIHHG